MARAEARKQVVVHDKHGAAYVRDRRRRLPRLSQCAIPTMGRTYVLSILQFSQRGCNACVMVLGSPSTSR
jgi:hypothetical protein